MPSLPGASSSVANDLNAKGAIVGVSVIDGFQRATLWTNKNAEPMDLGTLGGEESVATAINNHGIVVGWSKTGRTIKFEQFEEEVIRAFAWSAATGMFELSVEFESNFSYIRAYAINDSNWVVGNAGNHATIWRDLTTPLEGELIGPRDQPSVASDVNNSNQVSGWLRSDGQVFLWENGSTA